MNDYWQWQTKLIYAFATYIDTYIDTYTYIHDFDNITYVDRVNYFLFFGYKNGGWVGLPLQAGCQ
jgi:hypothetical protein